MAANSSGGSKSRADSTAELFSQIEEERREARTGRPTLDGDVLETRRTELAGLLAEAVKALAAADRADAQALIAAYEKGLADYDAANAQRVSAISGAQLYSAETRRLAGEVFAKANELRKTLGSRAGQSPIAASIKAACGVGTVLTADNPRDVRDVGAAQVNELKKEDVRAFLRSRTVSADYHLKRLEPLVTRLAEEIAKGAGTVTKGDVTAQVVAALWWIDIALERAVVYFREHDAAEAAGKLEARVPRKAGRRATDKGEESADGDGGEGGADGQR